MLKVPYPVKVLGPILIGHPEAKQQGSLSPAKQRLAAALVMAGDRGVAWYTLRDSDDPANDEESIRAAFRMSVSRLRAHLPPKSIEDNGDGVVRLTLETHGVDAWHLQELATTDASLDEVDKLRLLHLLQPVEPFAGAGSGVDQPFEAAARRLYDARHALMIRIANERPDLLRGDFVAFLRGHLLEDPFNERLLAALVMAEAHGGDRRRALTTLRTAKEEFIDVGLELSAPVAGLESELLDPDAQSRFEVFVPPLRPSVPQALQEMQSRPHVGHRDELQALTELARWGTGQALIHGLSGVGKSRLCAELAHRVADVGIPTVYLRPEPQGSDGAYAPLLRAMPAFRAAALQILERPSSTEARLLLMAAALEALSERAGDGALLVVADDSHLLDSGTAELIRQLPSTDVASRIVLVVAATDAGDDAPSTSPAEVMADAPSALRIELGPLSENDLRDMVREQWCDTLEPLVWNLARQLNDMSGGRAGVASILLASVPEASMLPDLANLKGVRPITQLVDALPPGVARVGAAAALLGQQFELDALRAVTSLENEELLDGLDELLRRQLLRETKGLRYEIVHAIVAKALIDTATDERIGQWHELAANHYADDLHRRAHHGFAAGDRLPREDILASLQASALRHLNTGSFWEAVVVFRKALLLFDDGRLDLELESSFARALELAGLPSEADWVRERAASDALFDGDHAMAMAIFVSGLPEGEKIEGDTALVERLDRVDEAKLERTGALQLAAHRSRQLAILGRYGDAKHQAERVIELARGPAEAVLGAITQRFAMSCTSEPEQRCKLLDAIDGAVHQGDRAVLADYYMLQAIDCYEAGRTTEAMQWRDRLDELDEPPLVRQWHGRLFDAMHARDQGELTRAAELREEALTFGLRVGVNGARDAHTAGALVDLWLTTGFGAFQATVSDTVGPGKLIDPTISPLHSSGAVALLFDCGATEEAVEMAEALARKVTAAPVAQRTAALAFAAEALAQSTQTALLDDVRGLLERRGRSSMVLGAGAASVGPVPLYLAALAPDDGQRRKHLDDALLVAQEAGRPLWEVRSRVGLARLTDDQDGLELLRREYADSELLQLINRP